MTYNVATTIEHLDGKGEARYWGLTEREVETLRRTIRETVPVGSSVDIRVTEAR